MAFKMHQVVPWDVEVFLLLNATMYVGLFVWSRVGANSFRIFQMACLLSLPALIAALGGGWRFLLFWTIYIGAAGYHVRLAYQRPVLEKTPRMVYLFFTFVHQTCWSLFTLGFVFLFSRNVDGAALAMSAMLFGVYFGIVNRDLAVLSAERMRPAAAIGDKLKRSRHVAPNTCGICSNQLRDMEGGGGGGGGGDVETSGEKSKNSGQKVQTLRTKEDGTVWLPCKHGFHGYCIRGWTMVGKRNICPVCGEKVDLMAAIKSKPLFVTSFLYALLLGMARFVLVWNPLVFIFSGYALIIIEKMTGMM